MWAGWRFKFEKRDFSQKERDKLANTGAAMPDGSFPIKSANDVKNAVGLAHMSKHPFSKVKAHIISRAKAIGAEGSLPDDWAGKKKVQPKK